MAGNMAKRDFVTSLSRLSDAQTGLHHLPIGWAWRSAKEPLMRDAV